MSQTSQRILETRRGFLFSGFAWFRSHQPKIADTRFRVVRGKKTGRHYLQIHGNESTAREALETHVRQFGGTAFFIRSEDRNVPIRGGVIDPNRLFSHEGAEKSLRGLNRWPEAQIRAALAELDRQRDKLIRELKPPTGGLLFAVHNNSQGYSVRDEVNVSDAVSLPKPDEPNDFFLATQPEDFEVLKTSPYNVVLQHKPGVDDGSLSRLSARMGFRYVNLECKLGRLELQREMMAWAERNLRR